MSKEQPVDNRFEEWLTNAGLYQPFRMNEGDMVRLINHFVIASGTIRVDCYCPMCRGPSVFSCRIQAGELNTALLRRKVGDSSSVYSSIAGQLADLTLTCARDEGHTLRVIVKATMQEGDTALKLVKIGQLPSKLDLLRGDLFKYAKIASPEDLEELNAAMVCHSHGFHVAAFVYLRRVFERRLHVAHEKARRDASWDDAGYDARMRMDDRILALKSHLPGFLVENRQIYGILSKGIHELTEQECADGYPALESAVGLILDEEVEQQERSKRVASAQESLQKLAERYRGS